MNALDYLNGSASLSFSNLFTGYSSFFNFNGSSTLGRYIVNRYIIDALWRFTPFIRWDQIFSIVSLVLFIGCIIAKYILFEKAGERGWKSLIPFYSEITLSKIITGKKTLGIILIASVLLYQIALTAVLLFPSETLSDLMYNLVQLFRWAMILINALVCYKIGKAYGKSAVWSVAMIFLTNILIIVMGFDKNLKYSGPNGTVFDLHEAVNN